jgi:hypothetical protein
MVLIIDMFKSSSKHTTSNTNVKIMGGGYDEVKLTPEEKIKKKNSTTLPDKALKSIKSSNVGQNTIDDPEADKKLLKFLAFNLK